MPLGKQKQFTSNAKLLVLKVLTRDEEKHNIPPVFQVSEKNEAGKYVAREQTETSVSGDIVKLELGEGEYNNKPYKIAKLYMKDEEYLYLLDLRYNSLTRSLFNALIGLKTFEGVSISLYETKGKKGDKMFASSSVWQNNEMKRWVHGLDKLPAVVEIKHPRTGEVTSRDFCDVDAFFEEELKSLAKKIDKNASNAQPAVAAAPSAKEQDNSDIMF